MSRAILWFRQDLRCHDNPALVAACENHDQIIPLYIFDELQPELLGEAQQWWLHHSLEALSHDLKQINLNLCLKKGNAIDVLEELASQHQIEAIYWNRCYEPSRIERDQTLKTRLKQAGLEAQSFNASLLNEPWTVKNKSGGYFKVFTPYWRTAETQVQFALYPKPEGVYSSPPVESEKLESWQLLPKKPNWAEDFGKHWQPGETGAIQRLERFIDSQLQQYDQGRDYPALHLTSGLSAHLHFGEISPQQIWQAVKQASLDPGFNHQAANRFLTELGWREFSYQLLYHFPGLIKDNFKTEFDAFPWHANPDYLKAWQKGLTGYPIVDAGMRELWQTGNMHNRVRMIVASFLTKHLLIDWRQGAAWFWNTLLDADQANNFASWQWVAGCGADAAPYFRIFNPVLQGEKFDPEGLYVKTWLPELAKLPKTLIHQPWTASNSSLILDYPPPIVNHQQARERALLAYRQLRGDS